MIKNKAVLVHLLRHAISIEWNTSNEWNHIFYFKILNISKSEGDDASYQFSMTPHQVFLPKKYPNYQKVNSRPMIFFFE